MYTLKRAILLKAIADITKKLEQPQRAKTRRALNYVARHADKIALGDYNISGVGCPLTLAGFFGPRGSFSTEGIERAGVWGSNIDRAVSELAPEHAVGITVKSGIYRLED